MAAESKKSLIGVCSLLMATLFALSATFQLNDPDWYFWIPLYAAASVVNVAIGVGRIANIKRMARFAFWLGVLLFVKVAMEDFVHGIAGFWSLAMRERVVREKHGSGLVICSMLLHLENLSNPNHPTQVARYGMPMLVGIAFGLSLFFVFQHDEIKY